MHPILTMEFDEKQPQLGTINHESMADEGQEGGHSIQKLDRNFSLLSICSVGIVVGSSWPALGGSIVRLYVQINQATT